RPAALRGAGDAEPRRGHCFEARLRDPLLARLALAVGAVVDLRERVLDLLEGLLELPRQRLDLAAFGGHLPGIGEVLVEVEVGAVGIGGAPVTEARPLGLDPLAL